MPDHTTVLSSKTQTVEINRSTPTVIIGERINPTGRKQMMHALQAGNFDSVRRDAITQVEAGARILDVNAGVPGSDEPELMRQLVRTILDVVDVPLSIDTADPAVLLAALELCEGKPLVNSVNGETKSLEAILPIVKDRGAAVIGLCMDDDGIPATAEERLRVADKIITRAGQAGIPVEDIVIDPLAMTMGADSQAGSITLQTIALVVQEFGVNMTMGASNVSFGLPNRKFINAAFLAMAIHAGLTCPITNPLVEAVRLSVLAADLSLGRDQYGSRWIKAYRQFKPA